MEYAYSNERPERVIVSRQLGQPIFTINVFVQQSDIEDYKYKYVQITLPRNNWNKSVIVSSVVKTKYSSDDMDAIRNNYELVRDGTAGDKTDEYTLEYLAMQDWRRKAKELAGKIMDDYNKDR